MKGILLILALLIPGTAMALTINSSGDKPYGTSVDMWGNANHYFWIHGDTKAGYSEDHKQGQLKSHGDWKATYNEEAQQGQLMSNGDIKAIYNEREKLGQLRSQGDLKATYHEDTQQGQLISQNDWKATYNEVRKVTCILDGLERICMFRGNIPQEGGQIISGLWKSMDNGMTWKKLN